MDAPRKRTPNRSVLRELARVLGTHTAIQGIDVFPPANPDSILIHLRDDYYPPDRIAEAYVEVQYYLNGDAHITYRENHHGDDWMCRWDRHESDDYTRDHFHTPPTAGHDDDSIALADDVWDVGGVPERPFVSPWAVHSPRSEDLVTWQGHVADGFVDRVVERLMAYLG